MTTAASRACSSACSASAEARVPPPAFGSLTVRFVSGTYRRHGSPRSPGHGGSPVGTAMPGTTGRISCDGIAREWASRTVARPAGTRSPNAHDGWSPPGAEIVIRIRDPAR